MLSRTADNLYWLARYVERAEYLARIERGERVAPILHRLRTPSGAEQTLESSLSFMTFEGRSAIVSWTRDITERMQLQAELMKRDRLAAVGLLAAGVAHEINNPLTALALQARKVRERAGELSLPIDVRASLEQIDDAAGRMGAIIKDLLFMARPVEPEVARVTWSDAAREGCSSAKRSWIRRRSMTGHVRIPASAWTPAHCADR